MKKYSNNKLIIRPLSNFKVQKSSQKNYKYRKNSINNFDQMIEILTLKIKLNRVLILRSNNTFEFGEKKIRTFRILVVQKQFKLVLNDNSMRKHSASAWD